MSVYKKTILASMIACLVCTSTITATNETRVVLNEQPLKLSHEVKINNGRSYIPLRALSQSMAFHIQFNNKLKKITLNRPDLQIELQLNSLDAKVNGKKTELSEAPYVVDGVTYVPLRFIANSMNSSISWNKKEKVITIGEQASFALYYSKTGKTFWITKDTGEIYYFNGAAAKKISGAKVNDLRQAEFNLDVISKRSSLLTINEQYGSSMTLYHNRYQFLLQDDEVQQKSYYSYSGPYAPAEFYIENAFDTLYLSDGKTIQFIASNGELSKEYDLKELTNQEGPFIVEYVSGDIILVRSFATLHLTLIDLNQKKSVLLYKEVLDTNEQKIWDENANDVGDPMYTASLLKFDKQVGNEFHLSYLSRLTGEKKSVVYQYNNNS